MHTCVSVNINSQNNNYDQWKNSQFVNMQYFEK